MKVRQLIPLILAILIVGSFWGCTKVYTNTGKGYSEACPGKEFRMKIRLLNLSTYIVWVHIPLHGTFELQPGQKSVIFEMYPQIGPYNIEVTYYRYTRGGFWGGVEQGTKTIPFTVDGTKDDHILEGEKLDEIWEITDPPHHRW